MRQGRPQPPQIPFTKVHGLGNDFILLDALANPALAELPIPSLAPAWCHRHTGIGADGVLLLMPPSVPEASARMRIFNSDGTEAEMCGNGIRCVARIISERHGRLLAHDHVHVQTGPTGRNRLLDVRVQRAAQGEFFAAEVDMGPPGHDHRDVELSVTGRPHPLQVTCVSIGNPHAVLFVDQVESVELQDLGPKIEHHPAFPHRTNVQFVQTQSPDHASVRTWERGAGPTLACGTGACAALVAGVLKCRLSRAAVVSLPGGDLRIRWDESDDHVLMTGPASVAFEGEISR
ncbi:MAG: diaminopimelate epimerase [Phycisphaerales bacterium]